MFAKFGIDAAENEPPYVWRKRVNESNPLLQAKRRCPGLVLVVGEDLTPYREASRAVERALAEEAVVGRRSESKRCIES